MDHINLADIAAYVSGQMGEGDSFDLELHIAHCDQCAEKVSHFHMIREYFNEIWETLTLKDLIQDLVRIKLLESLLVSDINTGLLLRIEAWIKDFYNRTRIIISASLGLSKKTTEMVINQLSPGLFGQIPQFKPVGAPIRVLGDGESGSEQQQRMQGPGNEKIDIFQSGNGLQIKIMNSKTDPPLPLIWAFSLDKGISVFKETYHPEETDYLVAEFSTDELTDLSEYIFLLEGAPQK